MNTSARVLLKDAVAFRPVTKRAGALERLFVHWFNGLVYNQIWEDPEVDLEALELRDGERVLAISSAGCNVLNYLSAASAQITAVDLNPHHLALTRLKLAALKHLPTHEDFLNFFGRGNVSSNALNYRLMISPELDEATRSFWEDASTLERSRVSHFSTGFYRYSRSAKFLRFVHRLMSLIGCRLDRLFDAQTLEEQRRIFSRDIEPAFRNPVVRLLGNLPVTLFSLGIPPQQFSIMKEDSSSILDLFHERVRRLACDYPIRSNYFAWQAFGCRYNVEDPEGLPRYLQPQNFNLLKERASGISTRHANLIEVLENSAPQSWDAVVLLDAQDWMPPEVIRRLWRALHVATSPGARIIFRSAGRESPVERALEPELLRWFSTDPLLNTQLLRKDRSSIYGSFYLYRVQH